MTPDWSGIGWWSWTLILRWWGGTLDVGSCTGTAAGVCFTAAHLRRWQAGYRLGSDRGSPNQGSTLLSKRVMAQIRSPVRVRTYRPVPWRMPVGVRR